MRATRLAALVLLSAVSSCTSKPSFYNTDGPRTYGCYLDEGDAHFDVVFSDQGRTATVTYDGQTHQLTYRGGLFKDIYANDTLDLTLDPEAYLETNGHRLWGPCI